MRPPWSQASSGPGRRRSRRSGAAPTLNNPAASTTSSLRIRQRCRRGEQRWRRILNTKCRGARVARIFCWQSCWRDLRATALFRRGSRPVCLSRPPSFDLPAHGAAATTTASFVRSPRRTQTASWVLKASNIQLSSSFSIVVPVGYKLTVAESNPFKGFSRSYDDTPMFDVRRCPLALAFLHLFAAPSPRGMDLAELAGRAPRAARPSARRSPLPPAAAAPDRALLLPPHRASLRVASHHCAGRCPAR